MPMDLGMHTSTGISVFAYDALRKYLGMPQKNPTRVRDCVQLTAYVEEDILERFHIDCIALAPVPPKTKIWRPREGYEYIITDKFNAVLNEKGEWLASDGERKMRMPAGGYFFDGDWITFENRWSDETFSTFVKEAERIYKDTEYFTALTGLSALFGSDIEYFCRMYTDPDEIKKDCEEGLEHELKIVEKIIDGCGEHIQMVAMGGDLGTQNAPFVSPEVFGELVAPSLRKLCGFIHANSDYKIFLHSCGAVEPLIDILIDCGIDVLNPVQITANGMEPEKLKSKYGERICFWGGGINTQGVLGIKGADEVRENVRGLVKTWKPGGGYVFNQVHNILGDVPPENIAAAYDEAYKCSGY